MWSLAVDTNLEHTEQTKEMAMQVSWWYKLEGSTCSACGSISNKTRSFSNAISQHYWSKQDKTMAKYKNKQYVLYICVEQPKRAKGQTHGS